MTQLTASPVDPHDEDSKWVLKNDSRKTRVDPLSPISVKRAATTLGISVDDVYSACASEATEPSGGTVFNGSVPYEGDSPLDALDAALAAAKPDDFLRWQSGLAAVDIDLLPGGKAKPFSWIVELAEASGAARAWLSKRGGGRLIFTDEGHAAAAILLLEMASPDWVHKVELLNGTRAPRGEVWRGVECLGALIAHARGEPISDVGQAEVETWLENAGLKRGRNPHAVCVIDPDPDKGGGEPVMVLERGVYCHRCAGANGDGFRSWATLLGIQCEPHPLAVAARECTHWGHISAVLRAQWLDDKVAWRIARLAYEALVAPDARASVFEPNWIWFRTESGGWVNPDSGEVETPGEAMNTFSWAQGSPTRRARARNNASLPGVQPIRVVSACLRPDAVPDGVVVWARRNDVNPWRPDVDPWETAFAKLQGDFPGCSEPYLKACIVASVCAEGGNGKYALLVTGATGTAKSTVPRIAAGIMGADAADLRINVSVEEWRRQIGQALESGARPLVLNEVDKVGRLRSHMEKLLQLQDPHQWRPLYGSDIKTKWRAPLIATGITVPEAFQDPEVGRRFRHIHLLGRVPSWYGRELEGWRLELDAGERSLGVEEGWRAHCADSLLRWAIDFAASHAFDWDACADALGLASSAEADADVAEITREAYRTLFDWACSNEAVASTSARYREEHHWLDLRCARAQEILEPVVPDVSDGKLLYVLALRLNSYDWTSLLGFPVRCEARQHGARLVTRFGIPVTGQQGGLRQNWTYNSRPDGGDILGDGGDIL